MNLRELIGFTPVEEILGGDLNRRVTDITFDSRKATAGSVFFALKGEKNDGHDYLDSLADKGLVAIVVEKLPTDITRFNSTAIVKVADTHEALGIMASNFFGKPSEKLMLIGVTGTNGKTTVATLLYEMARKAGLKSGLISTITNIVDNEPVPSTHTTPDPIQLNALLKSMVDCGCRFAAMEVSSHACAQKRIAGLRFKGGIFTNLTRDHLDYHKTFKDYRDAKKTFFDNLDSDAFALTNIDDRNGEFMLQNTRAQKFTYSLRTCADFECRILSKNLNHTLLSINGQELTTLFTGVFNAYNLTAVYGTLVTAGFPSDETLVDLSSLTPVKGRFQTIASQAGVTAIVDYAHTPDALENVIKTITDLKGHGRLITVVGAGGNRDKGKRPIMGDIASKLSDILILTSDNPRFEDPENIINDMMAGINNNTTSKTLVIINRKEAIKAAVALSVKDDVILIAGKGHENYQEIKGERVPFDDASTVKEFLKNK